MNATRHPATTPRVPRSAASGASGSPNLGMGRHVRPAIWAGHDHIRVTEQAIAGIV